jgi:hypothetical protein
MQWSQPSWHLQLQTCCECSDRLIHPQSYLDVGARLLAIVLLFGPFCFGSVAPLETIFKRICDSNLRKSYTADSFLIDMSWYIPLALAVFFSFRYVWGLS